MPTDLPTDLLVLCDRLEALAKEATPGEWIGPPRDALFSKRLVLGPLRDDGTRIVLAGPGVSQADAEFIAAIDPQTVSTLTTAVRRLIGERDAAREQMDRLQEFIAECQCYSANNGPGYAMVPISGLMELNLRTIAARPPEGQHAD